jgi:hypothetical protein
MLGYSGSGDFMLLLLLQYCLHAVTCAAATATAASATAATATPTNNN